MKKFVPLLLFIIIIFSIYSCKDALNPNAPFRERYALTGIIRNDTSLQIVTLTKSYEPTVNNNPFTNTQDPSIIGAEVNMWYKDTLYEMRDTTIVRDDTSHYKDSVHCYYVNNLKPDPNEYVDIEALLPNGLLLQSTTQLPDVEPYLFWDYSNDKTIPPEGKDYIAIKWKQLDNDFYSPRIIIVYYVKGSTEKHEWQVPLFYANIDGKSTAVYPQQTKINSFTISMETITRALNEIPQGDPDKLNYSIAEMDIDLVVYNPELSTYYSSIQGGLGTFTVTLDQPDYTNIQGGFGIFSSYVRTKFVLKFTSSYLQSLGYY